MKIPWWLCLLAMLGTAGVGWKWKPLPQDVPDTKVEGPRGPSPLGSEAGQGFISAEQRAADVRALLASPQQFMDALRGDSRLKAQSRILAAIAELPLSAVRELAPLIKKGIVGDKNQTWLLISSVAERWAEFDAEELLRIAREGGLGETGADIGIEKAFRHFAKLDPEQAWKRAQDIDSWSARNEVLSQLGQNDPTRLISLLQANSSDARYGWMARAALESWFVNDPTHAAQMIEKMPIGELRSHLIRGLADAYAGKGIAEALAWSQGLKNSAERQQAMREVFQRMAREDPQKALSFAAKSEFAEHRATTLRTALATWAAKDFEAAFAYARESNSPADQQTMLLALNDIATGEQRQQLLKIAGTLPPSVARQIYQSAMQYGRQTTSDPFAIIDSISSVSLREDVMKRVVDRHWSVSIEQAKEIFSRLQPTSQTPEQAAQLAGTLSWQNPEEAMQWAESLEAADLRKSAVTSTLRSWAHQEPMTAAQKAAELTDPQQRQEALRTVAEVWGRNDEKTALAWAQTLSGTDRIAALGALTSCAASTNPEQAREIFSEFAASLPSEAASASENKQVARSLAHTLTENDPQQAIAWVQGLAEGPLRDEAVAGVAAKWASYDARAASEWIASLPTGEGRDAAANDLVRVIARDDPESAWQWALSINDRVRRREAAIHTLSAWKANGAAETARAMLNQSGLSEEDAKELARALE